MGNSHSNNNNDGSGGPIGSVGLSDNIIIDLEGKYHIDYKNRNYKKLKPTMFSGYFENYEIVSADTLINSDFIKNKVIQRKKDKEGNNYTPPPSNRSTVELTISNINNNVSYNDDGNPINEQQDRFEQEEKEEQEILNKTFLKSSPVSSPSSSVSKKFESEFQLNPDLTMEIFNENEEKRKEKERSEKEDKIVVEEVEPTKNEIINNKSSSTTNMKPVLLAAHTYRSTSIPAFNRKHNKESPSSSPSNSPSKKNKKEHSKSNKHHHNNNSKDGASSLITDSIKSDIKIFSVDLSINRLDNISNDILSIMSKFDIQELTLSTNFFQVIPDLHLIKSLTSINFTRNKISKIQTSVFIELPSLTSLILDRNFITVLPDDFDQIKNLKYLSIKHNSLELLPNSISNLSQLISLDLSQNKIKALPTTFDDLINLKMVWLAHNQITSLPSMKKLVNLVTFDISSNKLTCIPKDFAFLVPARIKTAGQSQNDNISISSANCNNNDNNIMEMINKTELEGGGLGVLRELNIRDNRDIITLPVEYKQVESLMTIITSIPSEIIPGVFLGGLDSANNAPILQTLGITHILLAIGDCEPFFPKTFKYYSIDDARDTPQYDISQHFEQTNCFIEAGRRAGGVLVHCRAGISRSSTLILSYLMKYNKLTFKQSLEVVQSKRPQIQPNPGFKDQLLKYEAKLYCNNILKRSSIFINNNNNNTNRNSTLINIDNGSNGSSTSTTPNLSSLSSASSTSFSKLSIQNQ